MRIYRASAMVWLGMVLLGAAGVHAAAPGPPTGLLCELSAVPLGIESETPSFSWIVNDADPDEIQSAWQIEVRHLGESGGGVAWDSGRVESAQSANVAYAGVPLLTFEVYEWRVRTWDRDGNQGAWSEPQRFLTRLKELWNAKPIWAEGDSRFALVRREVTLPDLPIEWAYACVSARDTSATRQYVYRLRINGKEIGVGPARGFDGRVPYNVFDVTEALEAGKENVIAAIGYSADPEKDFILQLHVHYRDGSLARYVTDESWKALPADDIYNMGKNYFTYYEAGPENIDATKMPIGWDRAGFDDSAWPAAVARPEETRRALYKALVAQPMRNIELHEIEPARVVRKDDGSIFFDFGRQIIGGMKITLTGKVGGEFAVWLGEEKEGEDTVRYRARTKVTYDETWTLRDGEQTIENFGYRGCRYGELVPAEGVDLAGAKIRAVAMRYPFDDDAAAFESSDPILNEVWELCKYSIKSTALDVYQDCPTRERGPYEGDALINQMSHYAMDREFAIARYSGEYLYYVPTWPTEYKQQSLMMAWEDYMATGNRDSLARHYDVLSGKTLRERMNEQGLVEKPAKNDLVDWPVSTRDGYEFTTINTVINAFNAAGLDRLADIAGVLGKDTERDAARAEAEGARAAINKHLYDAEAGRYRDGLESRHHAAHANFFPLALGLTPEAERARVGEYLAGRGMACSVYGAQFLLEALYEAGEDEAARALMTATDNTSWHNMIHGLGATVVTEAWNPESKPNMSFAHAWASAPANIIPRRLMGIRPLEPGYKKVIVRPQAGGLESARLKLPTIRGTIEMALRQGGGRTEIELTLPANMTAEIWVPARPGAVVRVDGVESKGRAEEGYVVIENVGSGKKVFSAE